MRRGETYKSTALPVIKNQDLIVMRAQEKAESIRNETVFLCLINIPNIPSHYHE